MARKSGYLVKSPNVKFDKGGTRFNSGSTKLDSGDTTFVPQDPGGTQRHPAKPPQPRTMKFIE